MSFGRVKQSVCHEDLNIVHGNYDNHTGEATVSLVNEKSLKRIFITISIENNRLRNGLPNPA